VFLNENSGFFNLIFAAKLPERPLTPKVGKTGPSCDKHDANSTQAKRLLLAQQKQSYQSG
jgi:hypothetical protein